jgi:predicted nuclease of predicted toxin-antitoxin system
MMLFKVDEDLPKRVASLLRENGYDVATIVEQGMSGWKDTEIWLKIQAEGRFLLTADKGFADLRLYPPGTHAGIMLLRPDEDGIRPTVELLEKILQSYNLADLAGTITVVTPRGVRVRKEV